METDEPIVCEARHPSAESLFWLEVGRDMVRSSTTVANDAAKQIITLATALISAYLGGVKLLGSVHSQSEWARVGTCLPVLFWTVSIVLGAYAIVPRESIVSMICPDDIRNAKEQAIGRKSARLSWAFASFLLGIIAVTVVVLCS